MPQPDEFQKAAAGGLHVRRGVMGLGKRGVEEPLVQLCQGGQFELAAPSTGQLAEFRTSFGTGIQYFQMHQRGIEPGTVELRAHDVDIKAHVLPHYEVGPFQGGVKGLKYLAQGTAFLGGQGRGDPMDLFGLIGDVETFGAYQKILLFHQIPQAIVQLPGNLDASWPVVGIGYGGIPSLGKAGGLRVEYQVHRQKVWLSKAVDKDTESGGFGRREFS